MEKLNILLIDTSSAYLKIALSINGKEVFINEKNSSKHIENLLPEIDFCFKKINESKTNLNYAGVCTGPGSFTGLRIGISSILGISYAAQIKSFGFSIFDVYKFLLNNEKNTTLIPVIDAKKNRFYCSFIENEKHIDMLDITVEEIITGCCEIKNNIVFAGRDFKLIKDKINFNYLYKYENDFSSQDMLSFAMQNIISGNILTPPEPIYLRKSEAEIALINSKNAN